MDRRVSDENNKMAIWMHMELGEQATEEERRLGRQMMVR